MRTFATRLRAARKAAGFSSAQRFAGVLGMEPPTYRKYERGQSEPNFEVLMRICDLLNVDAGHLLPREAVPPLPPLVRKGTSGGRRSAA